MGRGKEDWKSGIGRCKLLCIGWINNKVLLYRMGNYIQHPIINHRGFPGGSDGKESTYNAGDLGWEDPLKDGMATYSSVLASRIPMDRCAWWTIVHGVAESRT